MRFYSWVFLALGLAAISQSAQARPRDDAMAGALRCAVIGDNRQWLDCYYGAAQPVRAQLGLPPALAGQVRLATAPPAGEVRDGAVRDEVIVGAVRCNSLAGEREWLNCYYGAAQPVRARLGLAAGPQSPALPNPVQPALSTPPARPMANAPQEDSFGLSAAASRPVRSVSRIVSRMESYSFNNRQVFTLTLANGQTWSQLDGDTGDAHWRKPASTYVVNISHGLLGSYNLQVQGLPGLYKVRRIR